MKKTRIVKTQLQEYGNESFNYVLEQGHPLYLIVEGDKEMHGWSDIDNKEDFQNKILLFLLRKFYDLEGKEGTVNALKSFIKYFKKL